MSRKCYGSAAITTQLANSGVGCREKEMLTNHDRMDASLSTTETLFPLDDAVASRVFTFLRDAQRETRNLVVSASHHQRNRGGEKDDDDEKTKWSSSLVERLSEIQRLVDRLVELVQSLIIHEQIKEELVDSDELAYGHHHPSFAIFPGSSETNFDDAKSTSRVPSPVLGLECDSTTMEVAQDVSDGDADEETTQTDEGGFEAEEDEEKAKKMNGEDACLHDGKDDFQRQQRGKACRTKSSLNFHVKRHERGITKRAKRRRRNSVENDADPANGNDGEDKASKSKDEAVFNDDHDILNGGDVVIYDNPATTTTIISGIKQFQCPHCDKMMKSRGCLESHIKRIHGEKKYQCGQCGLKYGLQSQLNVHMKRDHEGRSFPCEFQDCGKVYRTKNAMLSHRASVHEGVRHLCSLCGKAFSREESLISHRLYVHEHKGSACKECGKEFKRPESMHKHMARVHRGKTFPCHLCGKELSTPQSRRDHEINMHRGDAAAAAAVADGGSSGAAASGFTQQPPQPPPLFTCDKCGKVKKTERGLKLHQASVHEGRKFPCPICGQEFNWHSLRRNHIRTVHEGVKFHCDICGKNFSQGSALKTHLDTVHRKEDDDDDDDDGHKNGRERLGVEGVVGVVPIAVAALPNGVLSLCEAESDDRWRANYGL